MKWGVVLRCVMGLVIVVWFVVVVILVFVCGQLQLFDDGGGCVSVLCVLNFGFDLQCYVVDVWLVYVYVVFISCVLSVILCVVIDVLVVC